MKTYFDFRTENLGMVGQLDELSKETMGRYAARAMNDVRNSNQAKVRFQNKRNGSMIDPEHKKGKLEKDHDRVAKNREAGVRRVLKKLTNQDSSTSFFYKKKNK